ncbi:uncharacterized protein LOC122505699 [Leptopilina heterotoma]|uniref:uncharacterized protein LOC122505699 n=1 Tax=Leptopilina heterotoma TaxID=63436 RepID=UPI001CA91670|nr:uncharacterized protein LOC122505699 [Leptopilina heterotoma]
MGRPGRPKRGGYREKVDVKSRNEKLRHLKKEMQEDSAQMTSMLNLVLRPDRPSCCYCGGCSSLPKALELTEPLEPRKIVDTMVWIDDAPKFVSSCKIEDKPLDLSMKSSIVNKIFQPKIFLKDVKSLLVDPLWLDPVLQPQAAPSFETQPKPYSQPGPSFESGPRPSFGLQAGPSFETQLRPYFESQPGPSFESQPGPSFGIQAGSFFESQPKSSFGIQSGSSFEIQAGPSFELQSRPSFGIQAGPSFESQSRPSWYMEPEDVKVVLEENPLPKLVPKRFEMCMCGLCNL